MIVQIKSDWNCKLPPEIKEKVKEMSSSYLEKDEYQSETDKKDGKIPEKISEFMIVGHIDQIPHEILNHRGLNITFYKGLKSMVVDAIGNDMSHTKTLNTEAINIHLPSNELYSINKTLLLEEACTDRLQSELDDGWRIIACIPRAGQRRPDYILGRTN